MNVYFWFAVFMLVLMIVELFVVGEVRTSSYVVFWGFFILARLGEIEKILKEKK